MKPLHQCMLEYRKQLEKGSIQVAYRGLMEYIMGLRSQLKNNYPDHYVSGSVYFGYMDMTYFAFTPESLKDRRLKIAIVFIHEPFMFEVWLGGMNKRVQTKYWQLFKDSAWENYRVPSTTKGVDSIIEYILVDNPDFSDLDGLTTRIEKGTLKFIEDIENYLSDHPI